jgi:hypothetical protein
MNNCLNCRKETKLKYCCRKCYLENHRIKFINCKYCNKKIPQNKNKEKKYFCNKYCLSYYNQEKLIKPILNNIVNAHYKNNLSSYCKNNKLNYTTIWNYLKKIIL